MKHCNLLTDTRGLYTSSDQSVVASITSAREIAHRIDADVTSDVELSTLIDVYTTNHYR